MAEISIDTSSLNEVSSSVDRIIQQYTSGKSCMEALLSGIPEEASGYNISGYVSQYNSIGSSLETIRGHTSNILSVLGTYNTGIQFRDTAGVLLLSLLEGGLYFGQDIYRLLTVLESATWSVGTIPIDAIRFLGSVITDDHYNSLTEELWEATDAEISKDRVKSAFDKFYDNKGKNLKNTAAFENVRGVSTIVGSATADALFTYITFGIAKALTGAKEVSSGFKSLVKLTKNGATFVSQTSNAMDKGSSVNRSLAYGTVYVASNMILGSASGKLNDAAAAAISDKTESVLLRTGVKAATTSVNSAVKTEVQTDAKLIYDYDSDQSLAENVKEQHEGEGDTFVNKMVAANVTSNMPSSSSSTTTSSPSSSTSSTSSSSSDSSSSTK